LVCVGPITNYELELSAEDLFPYDSPVTEDTIRERLSSAEAAQGLHDAFRIDSERRRQELVEREGWAVTRVEYVAVESNRVWIRCSWKVTIRNSFDRPLALNLEVQFMDSQRFILDTGRLFNQVLAPFAEQTLYGSTLVSMPAALRVAQMHAVAARSPMK
jgi:hypothetical protein